MLSANPQNAISICILVGVADMSKPSRMNSLTGLRGLCACWIMLHHAGDYGIGGLLGIAHFDRYLLVHRGWARVDMFFTLSGFLLMHLHGREFHRPTWPVTKRFVTARLSRIYPLSTVALALVATVYLVDPVFRAGMLQFCTGESPALSLIRTGLLGSGWLPGSGNWNLPTWTLSVEIVGYALFPLLAFGLTQLTSFWGLISVAALACATLAGHQLAAGINFNDISTFGSFERMATGFIAGGALARAKAVAPAWVAQWASSVTIVGVLLAALSIVSWRATTVGPTAFALIIFGLSFNRGLIHRCLSIRPMLFLGAISFPIYLVHGPVFYWTVWHVLPQQPDWLEGSVTVALATICIVSLAWFMHEHVERRGRKLLSKSSAGWQTAGVPLEPAR